MYKLFYAPMDRLRSVFNFKRSPRNKTVRRSVSMVEWPAHLDIIDIRAGAEARSIEDLTLIFPPPPRTPPRPRPRSRTTSGSTSTTTLAPAPPPRAFVFVHPPGKGSLDRPRRSVTLKAYLKRSASKCSLRMPAVSNKLTKTQQQRQYSRFSKPLPPIPTASAASEE